MKALAYRDLLWNICVPAAGEGLAVGVYAEEHELFDETRQARSKPLFPIDLSSLIGRSEASTDRWTRNRVSTDVAERVGRDLWMAVPKKARDLVTRDLRVRLKIATDVPAVGDLPWEWLSDDDGRPFALRPGFTLIRTVPVRFPLPPISIDPPLRVLLLVPNPKDERLLDANREIDVVKQALRSAMYDVRVLDLPEPDQLMRALADRQPNVVHYIGHGGLTRGEGNVILQGPDGRSRWLSATDLASLLPSSVRLLCLATPFTARNYQVLGLTHLARATGITGLPTTVANQYPVDERTAAEFWTAFYSSLSSGGNVNEAVEAGRINAAATDPGHADWASFSLVVRDQTGVSFEVRPTHDAGERRAAEFRAQFAVEAANELAEQVKLLGGEEQLPGLTKQYAVEQKRATELLDALGEE